MTCGLEKSKKAALSIANILRSLMARDAKEVFILFLLAVSLWGATAFGASINKKTIKPAGQGGDYTSLAAWQAGGLAAGRGDLVSRNEIAVAEISGNWANPDTNRIVI